MNDEGKFSVTLFLACIAAGPHTCLNNLYSLHRRFRASATQVNYYFLFTLSSCHCQERSFLVANVQHLICFKFTLIVFTNNKYNSILQVY